ncbi:MAG: hypothetical protein DI630_30245 [Gordonia sp. (in: high G+C Gram-positive bacteria)]|nr:MAG: hypothetical protein DI630_30245 [Gordonia sp. (in: high G+C Gram-positive bacteria)]
MYGPTLFPRNPGPATLVAATLPNPADTSELDARHDRKVLFPLTGMKGVTLKDVAPPTGEFCEYLFAEWCDEEITDWATANLARIAGLRADIYSRTVDELDRDVYLELADSRAMGRGTTVRSELAGLLEETTKSAACAALYAAVAQQART